MSGVRALRAGGLGTAPTGPTAGAVEAARLARVRKTKTRRRGTTLLPQQLNLKVRTVAVDAAHGMVKACESGEFVGETGRIVIGFAQVTHHLYSTLRPS